MAILPKAICRFNTIPIKIPTQFFTDFTSFGKTKKHRIAKTILYNKGTSGIVTIPDFTIYYRTIYSNENTWDGHKNREVDQWN